MRLNINALGRDSQRRKLYNAENRALAAQRPLVPAFRDSTEYQQFLNGITRSNWLATNFPLAARPVRVEFNRRMHGANANENRIKTGLGSFTMNALILCHELGHVIVRRQYGRSMYACTLTGTLHANAKLAGLTNYSTHRIAGHGPEYADVYLRLVREFIGYDVWKALRAEFDAAGIRYCAPEDYSRQNLRQPRFVMQSAFAMRPATTQTVRNSNPNVSSQVLVNGTPFSSVKVAFEHYGLPIGQHQKFRKELKLNGANTLYWSGVQYTFVTLPK